MDNPIQTSLGYVPSSNSYPVINRNSIIDWRHQFNNQQMTRRLCYSLLNLEKGVNSALYFFLILINDIAEADCGSHSTISGRLRAYYLSF